MSSIKLTRIFIYPVKSLSGIALSSSQITPLGLKNDRRWMITDKKGMFVTQRLYPQLSLISICIDADNIRLTAPDGSHVNLPLRLAQGHSMAVRVWRDTVDGLVASDVHNKWISEYLGIDCKFIYMPDTTIRQVNQTFATSADDQVSFADGFPFLLISEASLQDLNSRLQGKSEKPVTINQFRPNLVVRGCSAYSEDNWTGFTINNNNFQGVKPCSRCVMTTIDSRTGKKGTEPLKTLLEYRKQGNHAYFGQNVILDRHADNSWQLNIGDTVTTD